jgi:chemotaxis response regulator CheB
VIKRTWRRMAWISRSSASELYTSGLSFKLLPDYDQVMSESSSPLVVIGASMGGIEALQKLLLQIPRDIGAPLTAPWEIAGRLI